mgnify:CR=1 FL=1
MTPKGTAAKSIWQHVAENPCVAASASFPACKEATFKFHICRIPRGCPGRLRRWSPSGLRWRKQSQAWQLHLLSCTCELQSRWASVRRRPPGDRNPSAHSSHVAFKGGPTGNQTKRQQQRKTTAFDLLSRTGDMASTVPGLDVPSTSGPEPSGSRTGPTSFYWARSTRASSVVVLPLVCNYETIGSKATNTV